MVIDLKKCIGCYTCQIACKIEHRFPPRVFGARVMLMEFGKYPNVRRLAQPLLCMHCKNPECLRVCPTGATQQRPDGIVWVDPAKCFGCRYCIMACPYGSRYFCEELGSYFDIPIDWERQGYKEFSHDVGITMKCDFCKHLVDKGKNPICVDVCPTNARYFGDLDDPMSEVSRLIATRKGYQLRPELGTDPSVYYLPA